jgi:hypothetical protein
MDYCHMLDMQSASDARTVSMHHHHPLLRDVWQTEPERERDASACMRRHQASALAPVANRAKYLVQDQSPLADTGTLPLAESSG